MEERALLERVERLSKENSRLRGQIADKASVFGFLRVDGLASRSLSPSSSRSSSDVWSGRSRPSVRRQA